MLTHLSIQNYAIVTELDIELSNGMTAITGETGAGKSIMLDALLLALGGRADSSVISPGKTRADICATLDLHNHPAAQKWLADKDLNHDAGEDEQADTEHLCLLRRSISKEGRSRAWINGQPATLQQLKELGSLTIDIHSQHEHQSLLQKDSHRVLLDAFSRCQEEGIAVSQTFQHWKQIHDALHTLRNQSAENSAKQQLLHYQVEELNALDLQEGELALLEEEQKQLTHAEHLLNTGQHLLSLLQEEGSHDSDANPALSLLQQANKLIAQQPVKSSFMEEAESLLHNACIQVEEACSQLSLHQQSVELNPERLQEVEQRLSSIYQIARKHHTQPEELFFLHQTLAKELEELSGGATSQEALQEQETSLRQQYLSHATALSSLRQKGAKKLNKAINKELKRLNMPGCELQISLSDRQETELHPNGMEAIEFLVRTNPGQDFQALKKVASGGELSRISLAIQVITAKTSQIPTLIFDEVDVGIGGETASIVGDLLHDLGKTGQVLCVTHQASVAAKAHQHLFVTKAIKQGKVSTSLHSLSHEDRVNEVARMIGGKPEESGFDHAQAHAEAMLVAS